jgi:hypothetical protein
MSRRREFFDAGSRTRVAPRSDSPRICGTGIGYSVQTGSGGALVSDDAAGSEGGAVVSRTDDRSPVRLNIGDPAFCCTQEREMDDHMTTCRDCGRRFRLGPLLDLLQPTRCMECLIGLEARYAEVVGERRSLEAALSQRVGMRRELEALLGVGDTYAPEEFDKGVERLRGLVAAESEWAARLAAAEENVETRRGAVRDMDEIAKEERERRTAAEARAEKAERERDQQVEARHAAERATKRHEAFALRTVEAEPLLLVARQTIADQTRELFELHGAESRAAELEAALREIAGGHCDYPREQNDTALTCTDKPAIRRDHWCPSCIARRALAPKEERP